LEKKKKTLIAVSSAVGGFLVALLLLFLALVFLLIKGIQEIGDDFGYSNEKILTYIKEKHGIEVTVIREAEPNKGVPGFEDARVRTTDGTDLEFDVNINMFGKISGDNYENVKKRYELDQKYADSRFFKELRELGFTQITFGHKPEDPPLYLELPEDRKLADSDTFRMLYEALPVLKNLQNDLSENGTDYYIDTISVNGAALSLYGDYESPEDLGNQWAADNIDLFDDSFIEQDIAKAANILPALKSLGFNPESSKPELECVEMIQYNRCHAYSMTLLTEDQYGSGMQLRYDRTEDKEKIFAAIQIIRAVDLPIEKIAIDHVYVPDDPKQQLHSEEELKQRGEQVNFAYQTVEVMNLEHIETAEEIVFFY
jgi:hypothetical protein